MGAGHHHGASVGNPKDFRLRLSVAFSITMIIVVAQGIGSWLTGSLALLTDTAHAATDASGLLVALIAGTLVLRPASPKRTWGFRRIEVIAALAQATLLLVVGGYAAIEGVKRLFDPPNVPASELLIFGGIGLTANLIAMTVLMTGRSANFNMRAAFLEVVNDALGSVGVIVAAIVIATTGFERADTIAGLFIAGLIVPRAAILMRETLAVLMEFTPKEIDLERVREHLLALDHVQDVHDLHASTVATDLPTLSAHIVVADECFTDGHAAELLATIKTCMAEHFEISVHHSTFQIETAEIAAQEVPSLKHA